MPAPISENLPNSARSFDEQLEDLLDFEGADELIRTWRHGLEPDPALTVSEWADAHRMLAPRALCHLPDGRGRNPKRPVRRHTAPHRLAQAKAGPRMMAGTSISDEVDGIRAPTTWPTHLIQHRMAANWSFFERITLRATVRCKLIAYDADPRHTFRVGRTSYGESRLIRVEVVPCRENVPKK